MQSITQAQEVTDYMIVRETPCGAHMTTNRIGFGNIEVIVWKQSHAHVEVFWKGVQSPQIASSLKAGLLFTHLVLPSAWPQCRAT